MVFNAYHWASNIKIKIAKPINSNPALASEYGDIPREEQQCCIS